MPLFRAVLFDLDQTLYDNDEAREAAALNELERLFTPSQISTLLSLMSALQGGLEADGSSTDFQSTLRATLPNLSDDAVSFLVSMSAHWLSSMRLNPGADELLMRLEGLGIPFGIVTNAPAVQRAKLEHLGLSHRTTCIFISDEFGCEKPDTSIFLAAATTLGVLPEQILFVGDSAEADILGAKRAGMRAAWVRRSQTWPSGGLIPLPDYVIDSLCELSVLF